MINLEIFRNFPASWVSVAYSPCHTKERGNHDGNEQVRLQTLLTLQYDRRPADVKFLRHLLTQCVVAAEKDSFQGFGRPLTLAAFLLAAYCEPNDAVLMARAKLANFDTYCGFPLQFLYYVGGEQTTSIIAACEPELWQKLQSSKLMEHAFTSQELDTWWLTLNNEYPSSAADEQLLVLYERATAFADLELANRYLEQWAAQEPDSHAKWSKLKYEYALLGKYDQAAAIAVAMYERANTQWDKAVALLDVIRKYRQASEYPLSSSYSQQLHETFSCFGEWQGVGLGRMAIHEVFELSRENPDDTAARQAFELADQWFQQSGDLALAGREAGVQAALRCGLAAKASEYEKLAAKERERISAMLS